MYDGECAARLPKKWEMYIMGAHHYYGDYAAFGIKTTIAIEVPIFYEDLFSYLVVLVVLFIQIDVLVLNGGVMRMITKELTHLI